VDTSYAGTGRPHVRLREVAHQAVLGTLRR